MISLKGSFIGQLTLILILSQCVACTTIKEKSLLFESLHPDSTGIEFRNDLSFNQQFNIYTYRNFYNGAGVGLGDFNNDGLLDIYLTANQQPNKLYLNKGNFQFEDITSAAGVAGTKSWSTGVAVADVNGDGWLDIYVCNSGSVEGDNKENELFINNGDLTFTERAAEYGIADRGYTTHAVFFDYDRDGDLDLYILNNSYQAIGSFNLMKNERTKRDSLGGDKLMRNEGTHFVDVSNDAGIFGSVIGFGLGAAVGDVNGDGWPDIYISNDFFERDYLYINNQNGTFRESLTEHMKSISGASMGADLADINNDGLPDLFVTEMLPQTNSRIKTVTTFENWDRYQYGVKNDYYHQFTRNTLQVNQGETKFSEVGRLAGVEATDWSWGALMFDMDNDGLKDIFVANGIYQDLTNQDYLQYISNEEVVKSIVSDKGVDYRKLVDLIPSAPVPDFAFKNLGNLDFINRADEWGLGEPNFSNGSAYGDLDNDGDLDLVVNHVNAPVSIYRNNSEVINPNSKFLKFILRGINQNTNAVGTQIKIFHKDKQFYIENFPNRGFESSVDPRPNIGIGEIDTVEMIKVCWPDGRFTILQNVAANQTLLLDQATAIKDSSQASGFQTQIFKPSKPLINWSHLENDFVDFDRDKLIYHMLSSEGPAVAVGDINNDGLSDIYLGGAKNYSGTMLRQTLSGDFEMTSNQPFTHDKVSEDVASIFFDADNDGDLDLYVCSGGSEFASVSDALSDRLYFNQGDGTYIKSNQMLPTVAFESTAVARAADFDSDGDMDLFVGIRSKLFGYGLPVNGYLLENNGKGFFTDVSGSTAPALEKIGMITDATWADVDNDGDQDLIIVGEFMSVNVLINQNNLFIKQELDNLKGWWKRVKATDLDGDGDIDFVLANHGLNSRFRASKEKPVYMFVNDFDKNGTIEQILCTYNGNDSYPMILRHDLTAQIPSLKKKYLKYESYKNEKITDIFSENERQGSVNLEANEFRTGILINDGTGNFEFKPLPGRAQYSPMYAISVNDFDRDGIPDIILGGNLYRVKPEAGRYDASYGVFLKGTGYGNFKDIPGQISGLTIEGEVREFAFMKINGRDYVIAIRNNDSPLFYTY
jgi:enediyne biosynthesis protein E4